MRVQRTNRKPRGVCEMFLIEVLVALVLGALLYLGLRIMYANPMVYKDLADQLHCAVGGFKGSTELDCGDIRYNLVPNQFYPKLMEAEE